MFFDSGSGDMVSSKTLSNVVLSVRELVQSYWKSNSVLETNVSLLINLGRFVLHFD